MPQVHVYGVRWEVSRESVASALQTYTGMGLIEAQRAAEQAVSGRPTSIYIEDFGDVYELADILTGLGVDAEADESDDVHVWTDLSQRLGVSAWGAFAERDPPLKPRELFDLPAAPRPGGDIPAPRFLPEYDNLLLSHADRARVIPAEHRERVPRSLGRPMFLVDGSWPAPGRIARERGRAALLVESFAPLPPDARAALTVEGVRLLAFAAHDARAHDVHFALWFTSESTEIARLPPKVAQ